MNETMKLTEEEKTQLLKTKSEKEWYKVCNQIKERRNGQYPNYLSREILSLFQGKFEIDFS
tara:strand:+ start:62 stop:244 length:183 start_codon:yes stop_codon:yes gene_type:complete